MKPAAPVTTMRMRELYSKCYGPLVVKVPFFDMAAELTPVRRDIDAAIARVLDGGRFVGGNEVTGFEHALAKYIGARRAIGTSSGTDALLVTLMALGIGPGDDVITTPLSF